MTITTRDDLHYCIEKLRTRLFENRSTMSALEHYVVPAKMWHGCAPCWRPALRASTKPWWAWPNTKRDTPLSRRVLLPLA